MQSLDYNVVPAMELSESPQVADPCEIFAMSLLLKYVVNTCWGEDVLYEGLADLFSLLSSWLLFV
jgi:hypothetical protein